MWQTHLPASKHRVFFGKFLTKQMQSIVRVLMGLSRLLSVPKFLNIYVIAATWSFQVFRKHLFLEGHVPFSELLLSVHVLFTPPWHESLNPASSPLSGEGTDGALADDGEHRHWAHPGLGESFLEK